MATQLPPGRTAARKPSRNVCPIDTFSLPSRRKGLQAARRRWRRKPARTRATEARAARLRQVHAQARHPIQRPDIPTRRRDLRRRQPNPRQQLAGGQTRRNHLQHSDAQPDPRLSFPTAPNHPNQGEKDLRRRETRPDHQHRNRVPDLAQEPGSPDLPPLADRLPHPRTTSRVASRPATVRDCCSRATGAHSSSRDLVAGRATLRQ